MRGMSGEEMTKDGAVRCSHCGSTEVVPVNSEPVEQGDRSLTERYECKSCGRSFSKHA
jgi:transposase-like protein